ncbi:unnamed protein product [Trichobilharzia szidati]|nr:unnamed protein product [Trichobilharzia szidati]
METIKQTKPSIKDTKRFPFISLLVVVRIVGVPVVANVSYVDIVLSSVVRKKRQANKQTSKRTNNDELTSGHLNAMIDILTYIHIDNDGDDDEDDENIKCEDG